MYPSPFMEPRLLGLLFSDQWIIYKKKKSISKDISTVVIITYCFIICIYNGSELIINMITQLHKKLGFCLYREHLVEQRTHVYWVLCYKIHNWSCVHMLNTYSTIKYIPKQQQNFVLIPRFNYWFWAAIHIRHKFIIYWQKTYMTLIQSKDKLICGLHIKTQQKSEKESKIISI